MEINPKFSEISKRDYNLVISAINGDQQAYTKLMHHYKGLVYYMLLKMIRNRRDAEEVTLEVFEKAFLKIYQYRPEYAFCTWLFKIASNAGLDYLRKKVKSRHLSIDDPEEIKDCNSADFLVSAFANPEENMISSQKEVMMRNVVEKLKPHYRKLVKLHYFEEYSFAEITVKLNMPLGTVKNRMFRSREILLSKLKTYKLAM
jgi:RNA polymerase sigma-70 factor (ECF subfamily)